MGWTILLERTGFITGLIGASVRKSVENEATENIITILTIIK